jgi:hypothetical protein
LRLPAKQNLLAEKGLRKRDKTALHAAMIDT